MARLFDPAALHANGVLIDWARLARVPGQRAHAVGISSGKPGLHMRWLVSDAVGIPPEPFVVWARVGRDDPAQTNTESLYLDGFRAEGLSEPMLTLEVDAEPDIPGQPMVLWGFAGVPSIASVNAVSTVTSPGPATLRVRAGGIVAFVLWHGSINAVRGASVAQALSEKWEMIELVGLPVDGTWAGTTYSPDPQGLIAAPTDPTGAAVDRLVRGLPMVGWAPFTQTGRPVPPWSPPDPARYVDETQQVMLSQARPLFAGGVAGAEQSAVRPVYPVGGPTTASGTAPGASSSVVPLLDVLLVAAGSDPAAALALGFGTAYPLGEGPTGEPSVAERDVMVTAHFPQGHLGDGTDEEYAAIVPWPGAMHAAPTAPTGVLAERAGLVTPANPTAPWRETIRIAFDAVPPSVALERPVAGALAVYESSPGPAQLLVESDPVAGGYRSLALSSRPAPHTDQVALVDSLATDLPLDLSPRTLGHAVAVEDHYGLWSPWRDVGYSGSAPGYPIPQVVAARLETSYAGAASCPAGFAVDVAVDWQIRQPQALELRAVLCPIAYAGADLPAGVDPYAAAPVGCVRWDVPLTFTGDLLVGPGPFATVEYLSADAESMVDPSAPGFPDNMHGGHGDTRRYRVTLTDRVLDFASSVHYAVAVWARQQTTAAPALWTDVAAVPVVARVGSPVPPVVAFVALPAVPLGSIPDAANRSHVAVQAGGIAGATKVTVWSVSETPLRSAAGLDPHPDRHDTLPQRYQQLQDAYDGLPPSKQRAVFTRFATYDPPVDGVDVALPRGSAEIHLFAVTAVNAAGVESSWPSTHSGLQAAAAPRLVRPTVPELSAAPHLGAGAVDLTVSARCSLPIMAFEIHATRVAGAATDVGSMGGPLQVVSVTDPPVEDGAPGGSLWTASVSGLPVAEDWRALLIRAVAVPAAADGDTGTYGARSAASPVASVSVPPSAPPDLSALTVDGWGAGDAGVSVQFDSSAPMVVTPYGPHMLTVTARDVATAASDPPLFSASGPLAAIPIDPTTPPAGADAGALVRGDRTAGRTPYAAWFVRPSLDTVVAIEVVLADPLGRVSVRNYQVPSGLLDPPTVTILETRALAGFLLVRFATDAPASDSTGPYTLDVTAAQQRILWPHVPFGRIELPIADPLTPPAPHGGPISPFLPPFPPRVVLHAQFSLPDLRTAGLDPLQPVDIDAVREGTDAGITTYALSARMGPPAVVTLAVTTPRGLVGTARATFPVSLP